MLERFNQLTHILRKHEASWKISAFKQTNFSYLDRYPLVKEWLFSLSQEDLSTLQSNDDALLQAANPFFPDAFEIFKLIKFPSTRIMDSADKPAFWDTGIPGRKATQIQEFSASIGNIDRAILEWCCGKQHLGRFLSELNKQRSDGLEIDISLVNEAALLSRKRDLQCLVYTHHCDVLGPYANQFINKDLHAIALHACGGLHTHLLQKCAQHQVRRLSFSPCCYHRFNPSELYDALSKAGKSSQLTLTSNDLRIAVEETKTAPKSETNKRRRLQAWRLGFDSLQRDLSGKDSYLETPSVKPSILKTSFRTFCSELSILKNIQLHSTIDYDEYEALGYKRFQTYERAELFRMIFRRALETWLILDRVLFLEEQGYSTRVGLFCSSDISPRNFFIDASLPITPIQI